MSCRLCGSSSIWTFSRRVLNRHLVGFYRCATCGYLQTESPYWLDEAYREPINASDTGILIRNAFNCGLVCSTLKILRPLPPTVADFAGGYGILVRLLRDRGIDAVWDDKYCVNQLARGFELDDRCVTLGTLFEVLEHYVDPLSEIANLASRAEAILASTELLPTHPENWWYLGLDHGQHVGFFGLPSLQVLADKAKLHLVSDGRSYHLFSKRKVSPLAWKTMLSFRNGVSRLSSIGRRSLTLSDLERVRTKRQDGLL